MRDYGRCCASCSRGRFSQSGSFFIFKCASRYLILAHVAPRWSALVSIFVRTVTAIFTRAAPIANTKSLKPINSVPIAGKIYHRRVKSENPLLRNVHEYGATIGGATSLRNDGFLSSGQRALLRI